MSRFIRRSERFSMAWRRSHGMDWKLFASTFVAIFVAELGDKTQLATLSLSAGSSSRWVVFAGAALALVATSAIAVVAGEAITRVVPAEWLRRGAGVVFIILGALYLFVRDAPPPADAPPLSDSADASSSAGPPGGLTR
jgi:Ca2+/H+ antiporter, TMEM165/GDT1 family